MLVAVEGDKTLAELSEQFDVSCTPIPEWKQQRLERAADVLGGTKAPSEMLALKTLQAKIGPQAWRMRGEKGRSQGGLAARNTMIDRAHTLPVG